MKPGHFRNAPKIARDFTNSRDHRQAIDAQNWPTLDELDHLDLADRAYTPGGQLEYRVHRQVRSQQNVQRSERLVERHLPDEHELDFEPANTPTPNEPSKSDGQKNAIDMSPDELRAKIDRDLACEPEFNEVSRSERSLGLEM